MPTPPPENQPQRSIMYPEEDLDFDIYRNPKCLGCLAAFLIGALLCTFGVAAIYYIPREKFPEWFKEYMGADWVNFGKH